MEKHCEGDMMVVIAVSIVPIPWVKHDFAFTCSILCCFSRSVCYTLRDILTIIPFYRPENWGLKRQTMSKRIELLNGKAQPYLKPDLSECSKTSSQTVACNHFSGLKNDRSPALWQKLRERFLHGLEPHHPSEFSDHCQNALSPSYNVRGLSKMQNVYKDGATMEALGCITRSLWGAGSQSLHVTGL